MHPYNPPAASASEPATTVDPAGPTAGIAHSAQGAALPSAPAAAFSLATAASKAIATVLAALPTEFVAAPNGATSDIVEPLSLPAESDTLCTSATLAPIADSHAATDLDVQVRAASPVTDDDAGAASTPYDPAFVSRASQQVPQSDSTQNAMSSFHPLAAHISQPATATDGPADLAAVHALSGDSAGSLSAPNASFSLATAAQKTIAAVPTLARGTDSPAVSKLNTHPQATVPAAKDNHADAPCADSTCDAVSPSGTSQQILNTHPALALENVADGNFAISHSLFCSSMDASSDQTAVRNGRKQCLSRSTHPRHRKKPTALP